MSKFELAEEQAAAIEAKQSEGCPAAPAAGLCSFMWAEPCASFQ